MPYSEDLLRVHVNVEIPASALSAIVENAKQVAGTDPDGQYRIDTAAKVGEMISRFLAEFDFESYVRDIRHFPGDPDRH